MKGALFRSPDVAPMGLFGKSVFLAGSIEMGMAEMWQPAAAQAFLSAGHNVFDPRRDDWDVNWAHDPTPGTPFETQVSWELDHIDKADLVYFRFCAGTASIVSMIEAGLVLASRKPCVIHADLGYMRRGNLVVTAKRYGVSIHENADTAMAEATRLLSRR